MVYALTFSVVLNGLLLWANILKKKNICLVKEMYEFEKKEKERYKEQFMSIMRRAIMDSLNTHPEDSLPKK